MQHNTQTFKIYLCAFNVYNDEAFVFFKHFKAQVEDKKEAKIKVIGTGRAGEYFSNEFLFYCEEHSIIYHKIAPYTLKIKWPRSPLACHY